VLDQRYCSRSRAKHHEAEAPRTLSRIAEETTNEEEKASHSHVPESVPRLVLSRTSSGVIPEHWRRRRHDHLRL
jgi:hypothetical protein